MRHLGGTCLSLHFNGLVVLRANPFGFFLFFSGGWNTVDGTNPAWVSAHSRFTRPPPNFNIDMYLPIAPGRSIAGNPASKVFTTYFSNIKVWGKGGQTKTIT